MLIETKDNSIIEVEPTNNKISLKLTSCFGWTTVTEMTLAECNELIEALKDAKTSEFLCSR